MFRAAHLCYIACFYFLLSASSLVYSQATGSLPLGIVPGGSYQSYDVDTVNVESGNAVVHIPIFSLPQLGKLSLSYSIKGNTNSWQASYQCSDDYNWCDYYYVSTPTAFSPGTVPIELGLGFSMDQYYSVGASETTVPDPCCGPGDVVAVSYSIEDSTQAVHPLFYDVNNIQNLRTADGSKLMFQSSSAEPYNLTQISSGTIFDSQGTKYYGTTNAAGNQLGMIVDTNGNAITANNTTGVLTDSVGRTITGSAYPSSTTAGCPDLSSRASFQPAVASAQMSVPGPNGTTVTYLLCYTSITIHTNFWGNNGQDIITNYQPSNCSNPNAPENCSGIQDYEEWDRIEGDILQSVVLPNNTYWGFIYDAADPNNSSSIGYGTLTQILFPTGGSVSYQYSIANNACALSPAASPIGEIVPWNALTLTRRTESDMFGHSYIWNYTGFVYPGNQGTVTDPNNNETVYTFAWDPQYTDSCGSGQEVNRQTYNGLWSNGQGAGKLLKTVATTYTYNYLPQILSTPELVNALPQTVTTTTDGAAPVTTTTGFGGSFNTEYITNVASYSPVAVSMGFPDGNTSTSSAGNLLSSTTTGYMWMSNSAYWNANLLDTPNSISAQENGTQSATTTITYDEANYVPYNGSWRGLPTTMSRSNSNGSAVVTHTGWTGTGMKSYTIDGNNNKSASYIYGSQYNGLYPTTVTNAAIQSSTYTYDFNTGQVASVTDLNSKTTTYTYSCISAPSNCSGRLEEVQYPDGGSVQYTYSTDTTAPTAQNPATVTSTGAAGAASGSIVHSQVYDGLGRVTQTQLKSDPAGTDYVNTTYDGLDHVLSVTNSFRTMSDPTYGVTTYAYDALGRTTIQTQQDGTSKLQWCYGNIATAGQSNCHPRIAGTGDWVDYADEKGNDWQRILDGLGRLANVIEPSGTNSAPTMETDYSYDALGNLLSVTQWGGASGASGARTRSFNYDSLSRLIQGYNPETGWLCYGTTGGVAANGSNCTEGYDANGNLKYKTDARGVQISYAYDALNRLLSKSYSDGITPYSCYQYDASGTTNAIGRLSKEWTVPASQSGGCSATGPTVLTMRTITSYDAMGRVLSEQQCTPNLSGQGNCTTSSSNPFALSYVYNQMGDPIAYTNGVNNVPGIGSIVFGLQYDGAGRLQNLSSSWNPATGSSSGVLPLFTADPANGYTPSGAIQNMVLGNNLFVNKTYDKRLRTTAETATHP